MKKVFSLFLSIVMILTALCIFPQGTFAKDRTKIFSDSITAEEFFSREGRKRNSKGIATYSFSSSVFDDDALELIADTISQRKSSCTVYYTKQGTGEWYWDEIDRALSLERTRSNIDSQYASRHLSKLNLKRGTINGKHYATYTFEYNDNANQELKVNDIVKNFFSTVNTNSISDYNLLKEIHDFIIDKCEYAYGSSSSTKYTAYGALIEGNAVCEGYTLAFYRLCKEAGFDVAIDVSDPDIGCHA